MLPSDPSDPDANSMGGEREAAIMLANAEAGGEIGQLGDAGIGGPVDVAGQDKKRRVDNHERRTSGIGLALKLAMKLERGR